MLKTKKQKMLAVTVLASSLFGVSGASAWGNSLLNVNLNDFTLLNDAMKFYNSIGNKFAAEIQNYSTIATTAISTLIGEQGQFFPKQTKQETEKKSDSDNLLDSSINTGTAALATNDLAGQQVLSKEGQDLTFPAKSEDGSSSLQKQLITIVR